MQLLSPSASPPDVLRPSPRAPGTRNLLTRGLLTRSLLTLLALQGCAGSSAVAPAAPTPEVAPAAPEAAPPAAPEAAGRPAPPSPSAGCGRALAAAGEKVVRAGKLQTPYLLTLPAGYDGKSPVPLVFAFHGRTRSHTLMHGGDASHLADELGSRYAVAYVKSVGPGYDQPREQTDNLQLFDALYPQLLAQYCIDTEQVFAVGHSSGGLFSELLACERAPLLRGFAAVAGARAESTCKGGSAAQIIHGEHDKVVSVSRGRHALQQFLHANGCSDQSAPIGTAGCVRYSGCEASAPVEWCTHAEPTYQDTNHGWPSTASAEVARFFGSLERVPHAAGTSLLKNESFDGGSEPWQVSFSGKAKGSFAVKGGALCVTLNNASENPWDAQLQQLDLKLEQGRPYVIDFRLWTSAPSDVRVKLGLGAEPYSEYWMQSVATTSVPKRVTDRLVLTESAPGSLSFGFQFAGPYARTLPLTLCVDEVSVTPAP
jgi:polyhydroxybutyrate depolymerase